MAFSERISISGTALSYLLKECVNSPNRQEGFLFGNVTKLVTNHISDSRTDNARIDVVINVSSMLPTPEPGMFYSPSGRIKDDALREMLDGVSDNVAGWYHYRQNNSLKPTVRDKIISRGLQKYFANSGFGYFLCCNITSKQTASNSTHTYAYRFYKVNSRGEMETLSDITGNLGESVSGYKRTSAGDKNDPYNIAVMEAAKDGSHRVTESVHLTLEKAAEDAAVWEAASREVSNDISCMLAMLAGHHGARRSRGERAASRRAERAVILPLVQALTAPPPKPAEPFDFVTDIIKNNLKRDDPAEKSIPDCEDRVTASSPALGHKRIHSEGAAPSATSSVQGIGNGTSTRGWEKPATPHSDHNNLSNA